MVAHHDGKFSRRPLFDTTISAIVVIFVLWARGSDAFCSISRSRQRVLPLPMVGNFIAGISGVPPRTLLDKSWAVDTVQTTSLADVDLECAYKASRDGWSAIDFHQAVDERGSGLVVALSRSGSIFGGFNPLGWRSTDDYSSSNAAFLWFLQGNKVIKCPILQGGKWCQSCCYTCTLLDLFGSSETWLFVILPYFDWPLLA
jgi:TLD